MEKDGVEMKEERKKRKFHALCQFFERRGYEFYTRTPMVKMGDIYPDLREFMPPTENRAWQRKVAQLYPSLRWENIAVNGEKQPKTDKNSPFQGYN